MTLPLRVYLKVLMVYPQGVLGAACASEVFMNRKEVVPYVLNAVAALIAILPALPLLINANSFRPTIEERGSPRLRGAKCGWGT